jgi:release factor glutamine methyltransferase
VDNSLSLESYQVRLIGDNTIANLIKQGYALLEATSDSAKLDVEILLSSVLNKDRSYLLTWPEKSLSDEQLHAFLQILVRRIQGEPIAYIIGVKEFWSLPLSVSKSTLIPRPDTETLVESVLEQFQGKDNINCLDLGTGTGAIALALASENPTWKVSGLDFNMEAVALAQLNAKNCQLPQVNFFQSDWFSNVEANKKFDLIVSNPPYIDCEDHNLTQGDVRFEPNSALIASDNGLADIKHIANIARRFLTEQGQLFFEHGFAQAEAVRNILTGLGFDNPKTEQDLNGHDRITWATFLNNKLN